MRIHALLPVLLTPLAAACAAQPTPEPAAPEPVVIDLSEEGEAKAAKKVKGDEDKRARDRMIADNAGILGLLKAQEGGQLADVFGSSGLDAELTGGLGGLKGSTIGEAYGAGGLGLRGTGRGGGGTGEGIGLGSIGTIGKGGGGASGYGSGGGRLGGGRGGTPPRVRMGSVTTVGALDRDIIRRIVRSHYGGLRLCYEQRLIKDPKLMGRVAVDFVIGNTGTVSGAKAAESIGDKPLDDCVVKVFERMVFPKPKGGGVVKVKYPIVFTPGTSKSKPAKPAGSTMTTGGTKPAPSKPAPSKGSTGTP